MYVDESHQIYITIFVSSSHTHAHAPKVKKHQSNIGIEHSFIENKKEEDESI